jgi:hypothetical protein
MTVVLEAYDSATSSMSILVSITNVEKKSIYPEIWPVFIGKSHANEWISQNWFISIADLILAIRATFVGIINDANDSEVVSGEAAKKLTDSVPGTKKESSLYGIFAHSCRLRARGAVKIAEFLSILLLLDSVPVLGSFSTVFYPQSPELNTVAIICRSKKSMRLNLVMEC